MNETPFCPALLAAGAPDERAGCRGSRCVKWVAERAWSELRRPTDRWAVETKFYIADAPDEDGVVASISEDVTETVESDERMRAAITAARSLSEGDAYAARWNAASEVCVPLAAALRQAGWASTAKAAGRGWCSDNLRYAPFSDPAVKS